MLDHSLTRDYRLKISLLLLVLSLGFVVLLQIVIPTPDHEFRRVLVCALELLFVVPYLGMLPDRSNFVSLRPIVAILLAAWVLASVASVALSSHWAPALVRQAEWFCHLLFAASVWHLLRSSREAAGWVIGLTVFAGLTAVSLVVRSWYILPDAAGHDWTGSLPAFSRIEEFAHLSLVGLILSHAGLAGRDARPLGLAVALVLMSIFWGAVMWSGTLPAFLCGILAVAILLVIAQPPARVRVAGATIVSASAGVLLAVGLPVEHREMGVVGLARSLSAGTGGLLAALPERWSAAWDHFAARPWYGHGPDAYLHLASRPAGIDPHNSALQFLTDWGIVGSAAFGLLLLGATVAAWLVLREVRADLRAERIVAFTSVLVLSVYGLFGGTYYHAVSLQILAVCFAVALVPPVYAAATRPAGRGAITVRIGFVRGVAIAVTALFFVQAAVLTALSRPEVPDPDSGRARFVRAFPSSTHNLDRWIARWEETHPDAAAEWVHWAHENSADAHFYRSREATMLAERGEYEAARDHAVEAVQSAPRLQKQRLAATMEPLIELGNAYSDQMLFGLDADSSDVAAADSLDDGS